METSAGMFIHQPSGLYLTLNRAYDPYSGRWLSRDPVGELSGNSFGVINETPPAMVANRIPGLMSMLSPAGSDPDVSLGSVASVNLYAYVGEDPINLVDPTGLGPFGGRPPGYWPGDTGAGQWGQNQGYGSLTGKNIFHGLKQSCRGRGADDYSVNPDTGDILDQNGESVGNLNDEPNPMEFAPFFFVPFFFCILNRAETFMKALTNSEIIFVGLYISGDLIDQAKINEALGLHPSSFKQKNDVQINPATSTNYHQRTSVWSFVQQKKGTLISQCLSDFSKSLSNRKEAILDIENVESAYVDILFSLISKNKKNDAYEFQLEVGDLQFLSSLGLPVQCKVMFSEH